MKILILNGSPKAKKSDTIHMTNAFVKGINQIESNEIEIINVIEKNINFCKGCLSCMNNGGTCVYNDDMREILTKILECNLLIFSFPLYCYSMPASLKVLIDRILPLSSMAMQKVDDHYEHISQYDYSNIKYVMICGSGFPNQNNNFEGMVKQFQLMFGEDSTIITVSESPMFNVKEAEEVTIPFLDLLTKAGNEYAKFGKITEETMKKLAIPMIPHDVYASIVNNNMN